MFEEEKYQTAAKKAMNFIKAQMDINHFTHKILFSQEYGSYYSGDVMLGTIEGFSGGEALGPTSISCPFYDFGYTGTVSGTCSGEGVNVHVLPAPVWMEAGKARCCIKKSITCRTMMNQVWRSGPMKRKSSIISRSKSEKA